MFPPFSDDSIVPAETNPLTRADQDAVIDDEADADDPLYEGPSVVHANGWIELERNRLLSSSAIYHIDVYDDERVPRDGDAGDGERGADGDDYRTNRFSPR